MIFVTCNFPFVKVAVLSKTTVLILPATFKLYIFLISIPFFKPTPTPMIIPAGVANPKAQGHEINNMETVFINAF